MSDLNDQFYDQLAQRLNRQDDALGRIECAQSGLAKMLTDHEAIEASYRGKTGATLIWVKWVIGGLWGAIVAMVTYLLKH